MKILFLAFRDPSNPFLGGGDIYINELAQGCASRGHSVTFIASKFPGCNAKERIGNLEIIRLGSSYTTTAIAFIYYFLHLRSRFDVIVEEIMGGPRIPFFASLYMKKKRVGILQQRHKEIFRQQFNLPIATSLSILERFLVLLNRNNTLIINSNRTKKELCAIGYKSDNMRIIYPGLPNNFFQSSNPPFSSRKPMFVCLTKIRRYKLIDNAIRAMSKVRRIIPNCELVIAGRTNDFEPCYENELRNLVSELNLSDIVSFQINVSESKKIELLKQSRALILPSAIEGFGIVVIEANACGTPVIVSDKVPKDAAKHRHNALVYPCHNIDSLSEAMISILSDEEEWNRMSNNSVQWAKNFSWTSSVNNFASVIESPKN
jgi:glycosyltransferase involved in cell wall biosynthesis